MKDLYLVKNESGFLKSIEFNEKALKQLPIYTQDKSEALICYERFSYVLRFNLANFEFLKCERVEIDNDFESTKQTHDLYQKSFEFDNFCNVTRKLNTINNLRKDFMKVQAPLIEFLKQGHFKNDGSVLKKYKDEYKAIVDSVKSNISYEVSNYDVIWVKINRGGIQYSFQVLTGEREDNQIIKDYKKITYKQYMKAMKDIKDKEQLRVTLKNQISNLKEGFYL